MIWEIRTLDIYDKEPFDLFLQDLLFEKKTGFRYSLSTINEIDDFHKYLKDIKLLETDAPNPNYSPATSYYFFMDNVICARIDCRWDLSKGNLSSEGGHIGYITSPSYRGKGIMSILLKFALERFRERGIDQVFITALIDNKASRATIEKLGGKFDSFYIREDGEKIARYWVPTF
ncbi:GNAT family N-acetyltransferase [Streptococcus bovimastitidis]|uniref:GNAT family N-acetyltransferase n=1 Tax=Streptococcus bovimastitidis TaxID=1856638 RepID=UPI0009F72A99|nr:GNAT family N-acetyltransferase [Streptococcus bovimastitidis]